MTQRIKLTVVLLAYNRRRSGYLKESIDAILGQTYSDFEFIVADNYSEDDTSGLVLGYDDPRLTYLRQPPGGDAATNTIRSLWMSRGEYVIFTHDDDVMEPEMLERQMAFIEKNPDVLAVATNVSLIDAVGQTIQSRLYELGEDLVFNRTEYIPYYLEEKLWFPTPTVLFNRKAALAAVAGPVKETKPKYLASGDTWLIFMVNLRGPVGILAEPLLRYRQHPGQESRNCDQSEPLLMLSATLLKHRVIQRRLRKHQPDIWGTYARFKTQDTLLKAAGSTFLRKTRKTLLSLKERWERAVSPERRAVDAVLPFEIFLNLFDMGSTISQEELERLKLTPATGGARLGYRRWLDAISAGSSLFAGRPSIGRIAIFGSLLTAFLIAQDAKRSGIEVRCCLDSSRVRIGKKVLGVPVVSLGELSGLEDSIDAVIMSSERDHESALKEILAAHCTNPDIEFISWKDLASLAVDTQRCTLRNSRCV